MPYVYLSVFFKCPMASDLLVDNICSCSRNSLPCTTCHDIVSYGNSHSIGDQDVLRYDADDSEKKIYMGRILVVTSPYRLINVHSYTYKILALQGVAKQMAATTLELLN